MKVGFFQFEPKQNKPEHNAGFITTQCDKTDFDLLVLPALANTSLLHDDVAPLKAISEKPDGKGPFLSSMIELAKLHDACIVTSYSEIDGDKLYISSAAVTANGVLSNYRKMHLYWKEADYFTKGNEGFKVFEYKGVVIGTMISFEWFYPEVCRTLAVWGAQIIAHPACMALERGHEAMITRSIENHVFSVSANRIGSESARGVGDKYTGKSQIVGQHGIRIFQGPVDEAYLGIVEIDPERADNKDVNPYNNIFKDLLPEYYWRCGSKLGKPEDQA